jgi:hypothetical protein
VTLCRHCRTTFGSFVKKNRMIAFIARTQPRSDGHSVHAIRKRWIAHKTAISGIVSPPTVAPIIGPSYIVDATKTRKGRTARAIIPSLRGQMTVDRQVLARNATSLFTAISTSQDASPRHRPRVPIRCIVTGILNLSLHALRCQLAEVVEQPDEGIHQLLEIAFVQALVGGVGIAGGVLDTQQQSRRAAEEIAERADEAD